MRFFSGKTINYALESLREITQLSILVKSLAVTLLAIASATIPMPVGVGVFAPLVSGGAHGRCRGCV